MADITINLGANKFSLNPIICSGTLLFNGNYIFISSMEFLQFEINDEITTGLFGLKKKKYKLVIRTHKYDYVKKCDDDRVYEMALPSSELQSAMEIEKLLREDIKRNVESYNFQKSHIFKEIHVVGVTYQNEDGSDRQKILRSFALGHERIDTIMFNEYQYNNEPALYVLVNDKIVGNVPANLVQDLLEISTKDFTITNYEITGGRGKDSHGVKIPYGMKINVRAKK
jgi:hypothetical protein